MPLAHCRAATGHTAPETAKRVESNDDHCVRFLEIYISLPNLNL